MFRMSHLGPHTFVGHDNHQRGGEWLSHFSRKERHRLIEEDRSARNTVGIVFFGAMLLGLSALVLTIALIKLV